MRTPFIAFFLNILFSGVVLAAGNILPYKTNVVVDGVNEEWGTPLPKFNKSTRINYEVANDEKNLYFIIQIADTAIQNQITRYGLEVWINKEGKKNKVTGVTFPLPMSKDTKTALAGQQIQDMPLSTTELALTGFLLENGKQPTKDCLIRVSISKDKSNCLIYELAVPFNTFYKENLEKSDVKVKFCFGFVVKSTLDSNPGDMGIPAGMAEMMMHRAMEGGHGYGGMGMPVPNPDKLFWIKTLLAIQ